MSIVGAHHYHPQFPPDELPAEAMAAPMDDEDATQPTSTQKEFDPRRMGLNNSGLEEDDVADVICILHPSSLSACRIVARTLLRAPQHILQQNSAFDDFDKGKTLVELEEQETFVFQGNTPQQALDLALRFSSRTKHPTSGFLFGRKASACDIVLDTETIKSVSNVHFRIFLNPTGTCMLEDMSTNGTLVDDVHLRGRRGNGPQTRMLNSGSIIQILAGKGEQAIKFVVRFPSREGYEERYTARCLYYMQEIALKEARTLTPHIPMAQQTQPLAQAFEPARRTEFLASAQPLVIPQSSWGMKWNGGSKYNVVGHLGKGAFATVYRLATKSQGEYFAAKELEKRRFVKNGVLDRKLDNELQIMKSTSHANIVQYIEYHDYEQHLYIIMEYVPFGDLQHHLHASGTLREFTAMIMSSQIFDALAYLHSKNITHRDIKPDNILIADNNPHNFRVKLSDFGLSKVVKSERTFLTTFCGTLLYCAPEVFPHYRNLAASKAKKRDRNGGPPQQGRFHSYSSAVDIWSFGGVMWYALCNQPPFEGVLDNTGKGMFENIMTTRLDPAPLYQRGISVQCVDLMVRMINVEPSQRPSSLQCLQHPWFDPLGHAQMPDVTQNNGLVAITEEDEPASKGPEPDLSQLKIDEEDLEDFHDEVDIDSGDLDYLDPRVSKRVKFRDLPDELQVKPELSRSQLAAALGSSGTRPANERQSAHIAELASNYAGLGEYPVLPNGVPSTADASGSAEFQSAVAHLEPSEDLGEPRPDSFTTGGALGLQSLMGAESLVRELNMDTPEDASTEENEPTTPESAQTHNDASQHSGAAEETPTRPQEETPKQRVFSRHIDLPLSASFFYDPKDPSTHNLEYASLRSGHDFTTAATVSVSSLPLLAVNNSAVVSHQVAKSICGLPSLQPAPEFLKPPLRLGRLVSTPDSFADLTITLNGIETTFGRGPNNTVSWDNEQDSRIPRRAFTIMYHATGIRTAKAAGKDWTKMDGLHCVIATEGKFGIFINGVKLMPKDAKSRALYGKVFTGDIITVWRGETGVKGTKGTGLSFVCEFLHGEGKERRESGQGFRILHD
ncbi:hypothetical protein MBLNU457_g0829t1 [Dothideomycetes sp. NU457]